MAGAPPFVLRCPFSSSCSFLAYPFAYPVRQRSRHVGTLGMALPLGLRLVDGPPRSLLAGFTAGGVERRGSVAEGGRFYRHLDVAG